MNMHATPDFPIDGRSSARSTGVQSPQDDATKIALYLAAQIQKEHLELYRQRVAGAVDPITAHVYRKIKELLWTTTRLLGLAHLHDGTQKRTPRPRHPPLPLCDRDPTHVILAATSPRLFIDVTPTFRFGGNQGIQRVVREVAKRTLRGEGSIPVVIENGTLVPYFGASRRRRSIEFRKGDKFLILDASWLVTDEYVPIIEELTEAGGQLVTLVYDLIPLTQPLSVAAPMTEQFRAWFDAIVLKSDRILCISRSVADDLVSYVLHEGVRTKPDLRVGWWRLGADFDDQAETSISADVLELTATKTPIFLSVGTLEPRKGYPIALEAFDLLWRANIIDARYVIVGRAGWQSEALQRDILNHPEYGRRLFWLNDSSDADLRHCYEHARALIFPSMIEGFGLPLVEAGRRGIPVIASDIPVFHEIGGADVRYFDLLDPIDLADEILRLSREAPTRSRSSYVTWDAAAEALLELVSTDAYQAPIGRAASARGFSAHA
ncbi:glycosyltransferase family 4 protein [Methylosinus sp. H3A]|uniref:glycosyltransferase family 4 protein n=1 Tax=Methylosinus sp. H3A TaxID=2785786 RepID=UPI0018C21D05|nr:glycosyltransferase family 1 protein [Methylosinus sp. H3A]MBG0808400.1 glycosyltransferase family 4 protein [Methylosinus sp. H3A]